MVAHFTDLTVWQRAHALFLDVLEDLDPLPRRRGVEVIGDHLLRSIGSVGANIAEGFNRSRPRFRSSLDIAMGEANEAENWLYKLRDSGYIDATVAEDRVREVVEVARMLRGLMRSVGSAR